MKWETPARSAFSSREPAPIQKPIETDRTCSSRSEMTRSPESSSLKTYFCTGGSYSGAAATLSPSSEGCAPSITLSAVAAIAVIDEREPLTSEDIEPWELHSELVLVCPEVGQRARELLSEHDPNAFLTRPREPVLLPADI